MARERRLDGDRRGFTVSYLTDQHYIGILPQYRPEGRGEGQPRFFVYLHLHDPRNAILDRVLDGDDVETFALRLAKHRIERGCFSRSSGSGDQHETLAHVEQAMDSPGIARVESERVHRSHSRIGIEDPDDDLLSMRCRKRRHPQIDSRCARAD